MKNQPVSRTPSYCVRLLLSMKSASKWLLLFLKMSSWLYEKASTCCSDLVLSSNTETLFWVRVFIGTDHKKLAICLLFYFFFYDPYPWPHSTSLNPLTAQQNTRGTVAAVENLPRVVLPLSSIETDQGVLMETHYCYPTRFFFCQWWKWQVRVSPAVKDPVPTSLKAWPVDPPVWYCCGWGPPTTYSSALWSVRPPLSAFDVSSLNPPHRGPSPPPPIFSGLLARPRLIKARKELAGPSNMQFVSLQGTNSLRGKTVCVWMRLFWSHFV